MTRPIGVAEAIGTIEPGQRVLVPPACGLPQALVAELGNQAERLSCLEVVGGYLIGSAPYVEERYQAHLRYRTLHPVGASEKAMARGQASYLPLRYFDALRVFAPSGALPVDVVLVQVAPPDARGRYSLGVSPSYPLPLARTARHVIAQVNPRMPRTLGDSYLDADEIDVLVEHEEPLREHRSAELSEVARRIAAHVEPLVRSGSTLQVGLGAVPEALLGMLEHKRNLRLHSLLVPSALKLFECGAISGKPEDTCICEIMGDARLFAWAHDNPQLRMACSDVVHDPLAIARLPRLVCVLSAVEVDLSGQINAEAVGTRAVGGIGGQLDFAMGASLSRDGLVVLALPSTSGKRAEHSRIVRTLSPGAPVTTPRSLVDLVITEHGVADLRGQDLEGRKRRLIGIADPTFREALSQP